MADWQTFEIKIPGKDFLGKVRGVLETLLIFLEILKTILETVKLFLIDFGNPIKILVEALIKLIMQMLEALKQTGIYGYFDVPNPLKDPNFDGVSGGYQAFTQRFKGSLYDTRDPYRPQPVPMFNQSGFVMLVVDAESIYSLIRKLVILLRFFGKEFMSPKFAPPTNVKVLPVGDKGDPILAVAKVFSPSVTAVVVEWALPTTMQSPDPGFSDIVNSVASEFIPPSFLIEKSELSVSGKIDVSKLSDKNAVGQVTYPRETLVETGSTGTRVKRTENLRDVGGELIVKFQKYYVIDSNSPTFWVGQLGTFRWIDNEVERDKTYYYRVRAYAGTLDWDESTKNLKFIPPQLYPDGHAEFIWPYEPTSSAPVMGMPSGIMPIRLPKLIPNFDVIENLRRLYKTAFSLNFHVPQPTDDKGKVTTEFDNDGNPIPPTLASDVGKGSLSNSAGMVMVNIFLPSSTQEFKRDDVTGNFPTMPWQNRGVRFKSAQLSATVAQAMIDAGSGVLDSFRTIMQGPLPAGPIGTVWGLSGVTSVETVVFTITAVNDDGTVDPATVQTFDDAFTSVEVRRNVLTAIQFINSFTLSGVPPDWVSLSLMRDIIPWSAQFIYDLMNKIQALLDAFKGVMDEIRAFIDLLIRKINALERFIQFLISILNFLANLQVGAYVLSSFGSGTLSGGIPDWIDLVDNAGGNAPPQAPGSYSGGIVLAVVGPDITAMQKAFGMIF